MVVAVGAAAVVVVPLIDEKKKCGKKGWELLWVVLGSAFLLYLHF